MVDRSFLSDLAGMEFAPDPTMPATNYALRVAFTQHQYRVEETMNGRSDIMQQDPFGNLIDWGPVLDLLEEISDKGQLASCQKGLIRILRYRGNWRLREEVLLRVGRIETPSAELIHQVLAILGDDNIYYDARILASKALIALLENTRDGFRSEMNKAVKQVTDRLMATPQPPHFDDALLKLSPKIERLSA